MAEAVNRIRHVGGDDDNAYTYYPVLIIGAGESGIAMGCNLRRKLGFDQFRIFERRSALGGTWHTNRYPGIACDVPAILYSFSFAQNPKWTSVFPSGSEIVRYLYDVCEKYGLLDKIQCDTGVTGIKWIEEDEEWEVTLDHMAPGAGEMTTKERARLAEEKGPHAVSLKTEIVRAKVVCSAVGGLIEPKENPAIPGMDQFEGSVLHTARWDPAVDIQGKDVVLLGTGCSAAQVLPQLIKPEHGARSVTQLLRTPPWAMPGPPEAFQQWWKKWMPILCTYIPGFQNAVRKSLFAMLEVEFITLFSPTEKARAARQAKRKEIVDHLNKLVPEEYREILTPDYEVGCKRRIVDNDWYRSLQADNVSITSLPLTSIQAKSVTLGPGCYYPHLSASESPETRTIPADVLIVANGFETGEWLHPLDVSGRHGQSLYKTWDARGGSQAYMGTAMDGFPNFFLIFGPNTATGHSSVILASENMVDYALNFIRPIMHGDVRTYEVKEIAERRWTEDIQSQLKNSVFMSGGCKSWYYKKAENGQSWNATVYPRSQIDFTLRCMFPRWRDWDAKYTRKGLVKHRLVLALRLFAMLASVAGVLYTVRYGTAKPGHALKRVAETLRRYVREALDVVRRKV